MPVRIIIIIFLSRKYVPTRRIFCGWEDYFTFIEIILGKKKFFLREIILNEKYNLTTNYDTVVKNIHEEYSS